MKDLYIKIITGFREDQQFTIPADEAHKAYYLFLHPDERGIFSNGVALIGKNIQGIEPDYNRTMGWLPTHELDDYDWQDIRSKNVDRKLRDVLSSAKEISYKAENDPKLLNLPLNGLMIESGLE